MAILHYFNPGHEVALLNPTPFYTPPGNVQRLMHDLAPLPLWYAQPEDYVLLSKPLPPDFLNQFPSSWQPFATPITLKQWIQHPEKYPSFEAVPWGLSPTVIHFFNQLQLENNSLALTVPKWNETIISLTSRETALKYLHQFASLYPALTLSTFPIRTTSIEEVLAMKAPKVLKQPYSSSGRGLLWIKDQLGIKDQEWAIGTIRKQGALIVEPWLEKKQDFAMEFRIDEERIAHFEGWSVYDTNAKGAYLGNRLFLPSEAKDFITTFVDECFLNQIKNTWLSILRKDFAPYYKGYLGVDMMFYGDSYTLHPCVEINLRRTMGQVANQLVKRTHIHGGSGRFSIDFKPKAKASYLLCPTLSNSYYRAALFL